MMPAQDAYAAFDRAIDPVFRILSPQQTMEIANLHADDALQGRIELLAQKANEGELTDRERAEYEAYARANSLLAVLKAKARRALSPDENLIDSDENT
jgi:hypothetical protein